MCLNIIPLDDETNGSHKFSGINKLIIIALAVDATESYENLEKLFTLINLNALCGVVNYCISSDLKCIMVMLGLQTCSSSHPCPWCNAKSSNLSIRGQSRTFKAIQENFNKWKSDGKQKKSNTKEFGNIFLLILL